MLVNESKVKSVIFLFLSVFFLACGFCSCGQKKLKTTDIVITKADGTTVMVNAEIARTSAQREYGFMNRKKIPDGTGMIFVFEADQVLAFWMKNTPTALSIAYIDSKGRIRDIFDMQPFSLSTVESSCSVRYALEVPQGWFKKNGIRVGDTILLNF